MKRIAFIGVPIKYGSNINGVDKAPDYFRKKGIISNNNLFDVGDVFVDDGEGIHDNHEKLKFLHSVVKVNSLLSDKVHDLMQSDYFPLVVGGDHSLGLGSISGVARAKDNLAVIWFDAHGDFNIEATSPTGNIHGMPCAALMGWCETQLNDVPTKHLPSTHFFWVGARDLDEGEKEFARKNNLHVYSTQYVREKGIDYVMSQIKTEMDLLGIENIHCSIDIDGMDPSIIVGTGTKVENGMFDEDFYGFVDSVFETKKVVSMDFVEYNPLLDDENNSTGVWCEKALNYLINKIKNK